MRLDIYRRLDDPRRAVPVGDLEWYVARGEERAGEEEREKGRWGKERVCTYVRGNADSIFTNKYTGRAFPEPTRVSLGVPLRCLQVACGRKHTLALMEGGYVMSWGT